MNPMSTDWTSSTSSGRTLQRGSSNVVKPVDLTVHDDHDFDLFGVGAPTAESSTNAHVTIKTVETTVSKATIKSTDSIETVASFESLTESTETTVVAAESPTAYTLFPPAPATAPSTTFRMPSTAAESLGVDDDDDDGVLFPTAGGINIEASYSSSVSSGQYDADAAYAQALNYQLNGMSLAPPPPQFKNSGNAVDIIAAKSTDNRIFTTSWHVMFSWSRFRSNIYTGVGDTVRVLVNGKELPTKMVLQERGRCNFVTGGLTPPTTDLLQIELFEDRPNLIRFEHFQKSSDTIRYVESRLHLWGPNESVVVADLDGTLTVSDVEGHIRTLRLGQYDFLHKGACDFFTKLHELDMRILYLTARPIDWATASRTHLENAKQQTHLLPPGPLVTNSHGLTGALLTEVVNKNPHVFKANVLNEIQLTLIHAGRVVDHPVFVAGFGNRPTDTIAYEQVGVSPDLIFLIDPYSNLKAVTNPTVFESYADPNALLWLLPKLKHKVPLEKVQRIDDYTVRELVLAEDREQLLMAEREARRLQEEEYERVTQKSNGGVPSLPGSSTALRPSYYGNANFSR